MDANLAWTGADFLQLLFSEHEELIDKDVFFYDGVSVKAFGFVFYVKYARWKNVCKKLLRPHF